MSDVILWPKYRVEGESIVALLAKIVYLMKTENDQGPSKLTKLNAVMTDGSKVTITLSNKPADPHARHGVEIDGARLG